MGVEKVVSYVVAFIPVLLYLSGLRWMDTYRLVPRKRVLSALGRGQRRRF